jgi:hypothetical protein
VNRPRIATIVEGHGEVDALPVLLHRIVAELAPPVWPEVLRPYRVGRDSLIKPGGVEGTADDLLRRSPDVTGLLILFDADDDCPARVGPELAGRVMAARPDIETAVVLANREFEAWFLAAAPSLSGKQGLSDDLAPPPTPEGIRGCKEWLSKHRQGGAPYKPRQHQPGLAQAIDLAMARQNAPSFAKFWRDVERLLAAGPAPEQSVAP